MINIGEKVIDSTAASFPPEGIKQLKTKALLTKWCGDLRSITGSLATCSPRTPFSPSLLSRWLACQPLGQDGRFCAPARPPEPLLSFPPGSTCCIHKPSVSYCSQSAPDPWSSRSGCPALGLSIAAPTFPTPICLDFLWCCSARSRTSWSGILGAASFGRIFWAICHVSSQRRVCDGLCISCAPSF